MDMIITNVLGILQIIILGVTAYYSYRIYKFNRMSKRWLVFPVGIILFACRRLLILIKVNYFEGLLLEFTLLDRVVVPFFVALLMLIGIHAMLKRFEYFEFLEKTIDGKVKKKK